MKQIIVVGGGSSMLLYRLFLFLLAGILIGQAIIRILNHLG